MTTLSIPMILEFDVEECCSCHVKFAMPKQMKADRREDKREFYCPNGHPQVYMGKSLTDQLVAERERVRQLAADVDQQATRASAAERKLQAAKAEAARLSARAQAGVCPCCKRTFKQLAAHMQNKHPEATPGLKAPRSVTSKD